MSTATAPFRAPNDADARARKTSESFSIACGTGASARPSNHGDGDPGEGDRDAGKRCVKIPHAMQVVELIEIGAFQRRDHDLGYPAPKKTRATPTGISQPASRKKWICFLMMSG